MRTANGTIQTHLDEDTQRRAKLLTLTRVDGSVFYFTDHDADIVRGVNTYVAASGFTSSSILSATGVGIQGMSLDIGIDAAGVTVDDVEAGVWKDAQCQCILVDWASPDAGYVFLFGGEVTKTQHDDAGRVTFEVRGLVTNDRQIPIEVYTFTCRADLGDTRCTVDIDALSETFTVAVVTNTQKFTTVELGEADNYWNLGVIEWTTGANAGLAMEVRLSVSATKSITLSASMPFIIAPGDTGTIWPGCDKQLTTCTTRYSNAINFRGEPFIPLPEALEQGVM